MLHYSSLNRGRQQEIDLLKESKKQNDKDICLCQCECKNEKEANWIMSTSYIVELIPALMKWGKWNILKSAKDQELQICFNCSTCHKAEDMEGIG